MRMMTRVNVEGYARIRGLPQSSSNNSSEVRIKQPQNGQNYEGDDFCDDGDEDGGGNQELDGYIKQ